MHGEQPEGGWYGDPSVPLEQRIEQVERLIQQQKAHISNKEMSDDFYFTRGGRDRDVRSLNQLEQQLKGMKDELTRTCK